MPQIYVVEPGDSAYSIARKYGVSPAAVIQTNELSNPNQLAVGQSLVIPMTTTYKVRPGDTIYKLARRFGLSPAALLRANPVIGNGNNLPVAVLLTIPERTATLGKIEVNGYALPTIDMDVLKRTLPDLTYLSIFSYEAQADGSLRGVDDTALIRAARAARVAPILVVTNLTPNGFSGEVAHTLLTNQQAQQNLIRNISQTIRTKNYYGLNIDFEYLQPQDREAYNRFLREISRQMRAQGHFIMTSIAPKTSANQPGTLYEAHDYPAHGSTMDRVVIMTYEWGYIAGPPLPIAPENEVRRVLDYAVTAIPPRKILMGMPNYAYDWQLPYTPGTLAETLGNTAAAERASQVNAAIGYDMKAHAPFYHYRDKDGEHIVWFEDARSIYAKLLLVHEYKLAGVSYWTLNRYFPQNWLVLRSMYDVKKVL